MANPFTPDDLLNRGSAGAVTPGTKPGFTQPPGVVNNGSLGGRPASGSSPSASPMETLPGSLPVAPMPSGAPANPVVQGGQVPIAPMPPGAPNPASGATAPSADQPFTAPGSVPAGTASASAPTVSGTPQPVAQSSLMSGVPGAAPMLTPVPVPVTFGTVPKDEAVAHLPEGTEIQTPLGVGKKMNGRLADGFQLNDAGKAAYTHAKVQMLAKFGDHPFKGDPNSPLPPVEPGQLAYNPFAPAGQEWVK